MPRSTRTAPIRPVPIPTAHAAVILATAWLDHCVQGFGEAGYSLAAPKPLSLGFPPIALFIAQFQARYLGLAIGDWRIYRQHPIANPQSLRGKRSSAKV